MAPYLPAISIVREVLITTSDDTESELGMAEKPFQNFHCMTSSPYTPVHTPITRRVISQKRPDSSVRHPTPASLHADYTPSSLSPPSFAPSLPMRRTSSGSSYSSQSSSQTTPRSPPKMVRKLYDLSGTLQVVDVGQLAHDSGRCEDLYLQLEEMSREATASTKTRSVKPKRVSFKEPSLPVQSLRKPNTSSKVELPELGNFGLEESLRSYLDSINVPELAEIVLPSESHKNTVQSTRTNEVTVVGAAVQPKSTTQARPKELAGLPLASNAHHYRNGRRLATLAERLNELGIDDC